MTIVLNSYDVCVQGFERLRKQSEFMLVTPVSGSDTRRDVLDALRSDMQCCARPDDFDWDGCEAMLVEILGNPERLDEKFDPSLEPRSEDDDCEGCYLFLYCEQV